MNGWSLVIIYCETGSTCLIQNLQVSKNNGWINLGLQVSKNNAHSTTLSCFLTAPLSLHLKGLLSFSLLSLYESFIILAKMEYLLFCRCVSLFLIFTYILIILCSWKAPPFITTWPESSIPFKVQLKCSFLFKDQIPCFKRLLDCLGQRGSIGRSIVSYTQKLGDSILGQGTYTGRRFHPPVQVHVRSVRNNQSMFLFHSNILSSL